MGDVYVMKKPMPHSAYVLMGILERIVIVAQVLQIVLIVQQ